MGNETQIQEIEQALTQDGTNPALTDLPRLEQISEVMAEHGTQMALALATLIFGLLAARLIDKGLRKGLHRLMPTPRFVTIFCNIAYITMVAIVVGAAAVKVGAHPVNMLRLLTIITLVAAGLFIFFRPFLPSLPFKVGNTVKVGDLLGKVESITFLNTRLRTFDGKTFFVPNRQIINDIVINYHFTQTRRLKIDVGIRYDQDLLKAKQILETLMIEDPRVRTKPGPVVYLLNLSSSSVDLGGRCWVDNKDYWVARCDLLEKTKLYFDREGIEFAFPQLDIHINEDEAQTGRSDHPPSWDLKGRSTREAADEEHI
jgi:small conductance mechanosensitive channel